MFLTKIFLFDLQVLIHNFILFQILEADF